MIVSVNELEQTVITAFQKASIRKDIAECITDALVLAELDGLHSHGFSRIPSYIDHALCGKVNGNVDPEIHHPTETVIYIDAKNGFAFPSIYKGLELINGVAKKNGIAMLGVGHSHHSGVLGHYVEKMAREGLVCIAFTNTPSAIAPWGGSIPTFGTNPIAFGCPTETKNPIVIDMSLSKVARGKIMTAKQKGMEIPKGWAINKDGKATTNPQEALEGSMLPMADAKGAALAFMIEILSATLTGSSYGYEASSFFDTKGGAPNIGHTFMVINPTVMAKNFHARISELLSFMLDQDGVRLPGERRFALREENKKNGVNIPDALYEQLKTKYV